MYRGVDNTPLSVHDTNGYNYITGDDTTCHKRPYINGGGGIGDKSKCHRERAGLENHMKNMLDLVLTINRLKAENDCCSCGGGHNDIVVKNVVPGMLLHHTITLQFVIAIQLTTTEK